MKLRSRSSVVTIPVVAILASACGKPSPCPTKFSELPPAKQSAADVSCSCDASNLTGTVWGSGTYTTDSSICAAAVHAGAIPATGGVAKSKKAAGCKQYIGSSANGVTASGWGAWDTSFFFPGHGDGACAKLGDAGMCPAKMHDLPDVAEMTCTCDAQSTSGAVWGSGIYTTDSSVCAAAVHAGAIPATGGKAHVKKTAGCPAYTASQANGVTSSPWASFEASFFFPEKGDGKCGAAIGDPEAACPASFKDIPNAASVTTWTCKCPGGKTTGSVWGTGVYTRDSNICGAAVHVGAISAAGGKVTLKSSAGCPKYKGSSGHGVTSSGWGSFDGSFYFAGNGDGTCGK